MSFRQFQANPVRGKTAGQRLSLACMAFGGLLAGRPAAIQAATVTILNETFEGGFPSGSWTRQGNPTWDDLAVTGWSSPRLAWCAGSSLNPASGYANNMNAWMIYGPFSLADATAAALSFDWRQDTEPIVDIFSLNISTNGTNFTVIDFFAGNNTAWIPLSYSLANYLGQPNVWIAFRFVSDGSVTGPGVFIDNVKIEKTTAASTDLVALEVYFRTQTGNGGTLVATPCVGQSVYPYIRYRLDGATANVPGVPLRIDMDGALLCSGQVTLAPGEGWIHCNSPWLATAGSHTLRGILNVGNVIDEANTGNNEATKAFISCTTGPEIRIDPVSLNITCAGGGQSPQVVLPHDTEALWGPSVPVLPPAADDRLIEAPEIARRFAAGEAKVAVIVNLTAPPAAPPQVNWNDVQSLGPLQQAIAAHQDAVLGRLPQEQYKLRHRFENQPGFSAEVSQDALHLLQTDPAVHSIEPIRYFEPHLAQGIPLMAGMTHRSTHNGSGVSIAICDSGVDYTHPRLGGGGFPNAKVLGGYDFGMNDADPSARTGSLANHAHGTGCAGIAAGDVDTVGDYIGGVAHNARIYALKMAPDNQTSAPTDNFIASWNWCITHKNDSPANPILVISTSYGGGRFTSISACDGDSPALAAAALNASNAGITILASAGNDGYCDALGWPACATHVISVGAVYDASVGNATWCLSSNACLGSNDPAFCNQQGYSRKLVEATAADLVTGYSDSASFLDILAPSNNAHTADIVGTGGYSPGDYVNGFGGTSAACPYAAGAAAALQSAAKALKGQFLSPAEVKSKLISTGDPINDPKNGISKPRLNLAAAIESLGAGGAGDCFTIYNDGTATLQVTAIDRPAWAMLSPAPPFNIPAGGSQEICVEACASCAGASLAGSLVVRSNDGDESAVNVSLTVTCPTCTAPSVADIPDHAAPAGTAYSRTPTLTQGTTPVTWSLIAKPTGMTIDPGTGKVDWPNPSPGGSDHTVTIRATNACGFDDETWNLRVDAACVAPVIADVPDHAASAGAAYSRMPTLTQGTLPVNWSLVAGPAGMTINASTGQVSWQATVAGAHPVTVRAASTCGSGSDDESWTLTVSSDPLRVVSLVCGAPATTVTVTVALASLGNENSLGFSINYDAALLTYASVAPGADAPPGTFIIPNASQPGRLGLLIGLPFGQKFQAGNRQAAVVTFSLPAGCSVPSTEVSFGDQPILREVTDDLADPLSVSAWQPCNIVCCSGPEADAAPRTSTGNGTLSTADWTQVGRFVAGLDTVNPGCEFQKADCAPRSCGNGALTTADWTQAGRYVAGLDTSTPACGPSQPGAGASPGSPRAEGQNSGSRVVRVESTVIGSGQNRCLKVALDAQGDESALGFSLCFDPAQLVLTDVRLCPENPSLAFLANPNPAQGRVGVLVGQPAGQAFAAGTTCLLELCLSALAADGAEPEITFCDQPVLREVVDVMANSLPTTFTSGRVRIGDPVRFDYDADGDVDLADLQVFQACATGPSIAGPPAGCSPADFNATDSDGDGDADHADFGAFQRCYGGALELADPTCTE